MARISGVELPGEFAKRGGILDLYAADWEAPVRIEWFDTEIESMREFDDRAHDVLLALVTDHLEYERLVDLEFVRRQIFEERHGRVSGPEVIN